MLYFSITIGNTNCIYYLCTRNQTERNHTRRRNQTAPIGSVCKYNEKKDDGKQKTDKSSLRLREKAGRELQCERGGRKARP